MCTASTIDSAQIAAIWLLQHIRIAIRDRAVAYADIQLLTGSVILTNVDGSHGHAE